jgi:CDP-diacylglycerol---glycerol-3-phosphate 3-phosphatidyltransferase
MTPNQVTLARVAAAFAAVALFTLGAGAALDLIAVLLTITAIALDGIDGYLARTRGLATPLGAQLDILGDRIVENLFFTFFAVSGLISLWVPVLFFVRGALTDFLRGLAARAGHGGFGGHSMLNGWWGKQLVSSRASRGIYATLKCICFCCLGMALALRNLSAAQFHMWLGPEVSHWPLAAAQILTAATAAFCLLRAIPVVWEGQRYLAVVERSAQRVVASLSR